MHEDIASWVRIGLGSALLTWESSGSITIVPLAFKVSTRPHCSSSLSTFLTVDTEMLY